MNWWRNLKGKIRLAEPLKNHTTFKIGGPAKFFIEPQDPNDLRLLLSLINPVRKSHTSKIKFSNGVKRYRIPIYVIGRGSNLLISDKGINGVVLRLNAPWFNKLSYRDDYLEAGSGVLLSKVVLFAKDHGLSGTEFLAGIPGTVGGALAMNAGIAKKINPSISLRVDGEQSRTSKNIGDLVETVTVMDYNGKIKTLHKKDIEFGYRKSSLSKYIILGTSIRLAKENKKRIKERIKKYINYRKSTQDLSKPSAGCIFRNPKGHSAGRLIDLCGLKGKRVGDAGVSLKHANFILNLENAAARDVLQLTDLIKKEVRKKFNIDLKPEIKIWQ
jgi:UDP-N-acetylmuramate dehydrogenase